jgi:HD-like signal output (HDOD) protein
MSSKGRTEASAEELGEKAQRLRARLLELIALEKLPVPMLPEVAAEVLRMTADDSANIARLSVLIHKDPALAARAVRLANSAAYAPRMPIASLQQAITRLGLAALREVVVSASIESGVFHVPGFEAELRGLWRHSLASALYAKEIARRRRFDVDSAFLCGLVHRIGAPVTLQAALDGAAGQELPMRSAAGRLHVFALASELAPLAGATVTSSWKLPPEVVACARYHEAPEAAGLGARDCAVVFVARQLATTALAPEGSAPAVTPEHAAYAIAGLNEREIDGLLLKLAAMRAQVDELTSS